MTLSCPGCSSIAIDTGIRKDPETGALRKRCYCQHCGREFWKSEAPEVAPVTVPVARGIGPGSWLLESRYGWYREGHSYAASQTHAIDALSKCSPEELYYAVVAVLRGAHRAGYDVTLPEALHVPARTPKDPTP